LIDIGRTNISGQRGEDIADRDSQGFRLDTIDGEADVRRIRAKGGDDPLHLRVGLGRIDDRLRRII
jgi:hypothetical protein